jgi:hypothetical protein
VFLFFSVSFSISPWLNEKKATSAIEVKPNINKKNKQIKIEI